MTFRACFLQKILFFFLNLIRWKKQVLFTNLEYIYPQINLSQKKIFYKKLLKNLTQDAADFITKSCIYSAKNSKFIIDSKSLPVLEKMKKGGLMLTAHFENYEAIGPWLVRLNIPLVASYARLHPKFLDKLVYKHFRTIDSQSYSLFINNPKDIIQNLKAGKLFCLLADQDYRKSHFICGNFLKKTVHCNPIPQFILSHLSQTPVYLCWLNSQNNHKILFAKEIYPKNGEELFQFFHQWLELQIEKSPEKWYGWVHRRYLSTMNSPSN